MPPKRLDTKGLSEDRIRAVMSEVNLALKLNEEELLPIARENISRYMGDHVPNFGGDWDIILNEVYPVIQQNLPATFFKTPRAFLKPRNKTYIARRRNPITEEMETVQLDSTKSANTQSAILNYQLQEIKYKRETRRVLLDSFIFPHAVLWHGYKGDFGMTDEQSMIIRKGKVFVKRISPMRFIKDPAVTFSNVDEGGWQGRVIDIRLEDLLEDNDLHVQKDQIKGFLGFGEKVGAKSFLDDPRRQNQDVMNIPRKSLIDFADEEFKKSSASRFVQAYEIFLRPNKKERLKGEKGWILLLTNEQKQPLRVDRWGIKAEGYPGHLLQFNEVPDKMFSLPDIRTYSSIADHKNVITNLQIRNAQENTKVWVGINKMSDSEEDLEKVQTGENTILLFDGDVPPSQRMFVASPGGQASSELYLIDQRIDKNLQDKSMVSDLRRGFLQSGEESAASVKLRNAGSSARPVYRQDIMADFLTDSVKYIAQLNKQYIPFTEAVRIVGSLDIEWSDNISAEEIQAETDVEIDVVSMLPENPEEELRRLNETLALMVQGINDPGVARKLQEEGKTINLSPIIEQILIRQRIRNPEVFRNIKPEESQGFVSVAEIRAARANVQSALGGQPGVPSPPQEGQDHIARIEVYASILQIIQQTGETIASQILTQLVQVHQALLQQETEKQPTPGQSVNLRKGSVQIVGAA